MALYRTCSKCDGEHLHTHRGWHIAPEIHHDCCVWVFWKCGTSRTTCASRTFEEAERAINGLTLDTTPDPIQTLMDRLHGTGLGIPTHLLQPTAEWILSQGKEIHDLYQTWWKDQP